jgi:hypothetical protein
VSAPVFISYSSIDQKIAETICEALESRSCPCWISCRNVGPGENFQEAIVRAIRSAKLMILVFTSNANNSDEIKKEIVLAGQHRVTVIPVRVEDVAPNDALAYEFATRQWIDLFKDWERQIEQLTLRIESILTEGAAHRDAGAAIGTKPLPPAPVKQSAARRTLWLAALVVVALGLGAAYFYLRPAASPDEREWLAAANAGTVPALRQYLNRFPDGAHAAQAKQSIRIEDDMAWSEAQRTSTVVAFNQYVGQFPDGAHIAQAHGRIADLGQKAADESAWLDADNAGTIPSFNAYLGAFPAGAHAAQARQRIADLETAPVSQPPKIVDTRRFDGLWTVKMSCPKTATALPITSGLVARVKDAHLHAQIGNEGKPGVMTIDGKIEPDGLATLSVSGLTGKPEYNQENIASGLPFAYQIVPQFDGSRGVADVRLPLGRPCNFTFTKN